MTQINWELSLSVIGTLVGVAGLAFGAYQLLRTKRASFIVDEWGSDICANLAQASESLNRLKRQIDEVDAVAWNQWRGQVASGVEETAKRLHGLTETMNRFIRVVTKAK